MPTCVRDMAAALERALARRIEEPRYNLWFRNRTKFTLQGETLVVGVPNRFYQEYVQKTFAREVAAAARDLLGHVVEVRFVIDPELFRASRKEQEETRNAKPGEAQVDGRAVSTKAGGSDAETTDNSAPDKKHPASSKTIRKKSRPRRWRRLHEFVVGPCNRVAHASALAIVDHPGLEVNPLVLHGPVGTGKSHLLEGIYIEIQRSHPHWRVCFVTAEDFTNRFVQAMRLGKLSSFRKHFRECDAFILDDLHFLASKRATQEEFLHTFDVLHGEGRQLAVTCDCHPRLNEQFMPELVDRLLGGGVWGVMPPDFDTRLNLLRTLCHRKEGLPLTEEALNFLADQLRGNVRELEGALNSILHFSKVTSRRIDVPLIREALGDLLRQCLRIIQLRDIDRSICHILRMETGSLQSKDRSWAYSHPRMLAMYLARKHTTASYSEIGRYFGNRTHSSVVAAEKKARNWLREDESLSLGKQQVRVRDVIEQVERELLQ